MFIIRIFGKTVALFAVLIVTVVQLLLVYLFRRSSFVFNLLATLFLMGGLVVLILGGTSGVFVLKIIFVGFVTFLIPIVGLALACFFDPLIEKLCNYIKS